MGQIEEQILQCLILDGRAPFRRIGEVVGISEQTVARRYRAMHEAGQLRVLVERTGFSADQRALWVRLRCRPDAAAPLADALAGRREVGWVALVSGGSEITCRIVAPVGDDSGGVLHRLPRSAAVLSLTAQTLLRPFAVSTSEWTMFDSLLDDDQVAHLLAGTRPRHRGRSTLVEEDRPLLTELARDGRATVAALGRALGWPGSRVADRLRSLLEGGQLVVVTDFLPEAFGYHATALMHLTVPPGRIVEVGEALATHPQTGFVAATTGSANLMAAVTCRSADDLFDYITTEVGALPDVQQLDLVPYVRRVKQARCLVMDGRLRAD